METSLQAQFLIPLAVSIGYGVLFGTVIIVLTVPAIFMAQDYVSRGLRANLCGSVCKARSNRSNTGRAKRALGLRTDLMAPFSSGRTKPAVRLE